MSSKLALLLKQKASAFISNQVAHVEPPAKRQKKLEGSTAGSKPPSHSAAAAGSKRQHAPALQQPPAAAVVAEANDDSNDDDLGLAASTDAYAELVGLLSSRRGALGAALKQRQLQEQEGVSDNEDDSAGAEGDPEDFVEDGAASHGSDANDASENGEAGYLGSENMDKEHETAAEHDNEQPQQEPDAVASNVPKGWRPNCHNTNEEQQQQQQHDNKAAAARAGGASGSSSVTTNWELFMSRELSDAKVAALKSGKQSWADPAGDDPSTGLWKRARWQVAGRPGMPPAPSTLFAYGVKERLIARWHEVHRADSERIASSAAASSSAPSIQPGINDFTSPQQRLLFSLCDSYADVLYAAKPYPGGPGWSAAVPDESIDAVLLHVLNHCAKTADVIKKNNDKLKAPGQADVADVPRDQGFTRPKALILLPMRSMAFHVVRRLVALAQKETRADSVQGKEKFLEQFIGEDDEEDEQQQQPGANAAASGKKKGPQKPAEHRALFRGNLDDHFRVGIRITRGQIKLFADFLQSDIIVASPMGLATKLAEDAAAAAGGGKGAGFKGKGAKGAGPRGGAVAGSAAAAGTGSEADFLSSIEVCVLERADVMLMQNWQHVVTVLEALNQLPKQQHGTDIMRVRLHLLASQGQLYRQTIITSSFASPQLNAVFGSLCSSHAGKCRLTTQPTGVLSSVVPQVRQLFERFTAPSAAAVADARFEFFKSLIWPRLNDAAASGLLLVVPSYFDFVRLRNFIKSEEADYAVLSEYCKFSEVTRARAVFFQRRVKLLLYTERAHFYHRYRIRGIQDIVFYGLPDHAHFYSELVNLVQVGGAAAAGHHATITSLFCQYDALALSRVVGHSRATKMLAADSTPTFVFC